MATGITPTEMTGDTPDFAHGLEELAGLVNFQVGAWHDFGYETPPAPECKRIPPLGERSAEAIKAGHAAIKTIDELTRQLYALREHLVGELRQDSDVRGARVDAMLAARPADAVGQPVDRPGDQRMPVCLVCGVRPVAGPDVVVCAGCDLTGADPADAR